MKKIFPIILILFLTNTIILKAQDPVLSNVSSNAIYINPAFAGSKNVYRFTFNTQLIWFNAIENQIVNSFALDFPIKRLGIGINAMYNISNPALKYTNTDFAISYKFGHYRKFTFTPAVKVSYMNRSLQGDKLTFYDQLSVYDGKFTDYTIAQTEFDLLHIFDVSAGFITHFPIEVHRTQPAWIDFGFAVHHIPKQNLSYIGISENVYPRKYTVHGGILIQLYRKNKITKLHNATKFKLYPNFMYHRQADFSVIDAGLLVYRSPFVVGLKFRSFERFKIANKNQIVGSLGFEGLFGNFISYQIMYNINWAVTGNNHLRYAPSFVTHEFSIKIFFANKRRSDCKFQKKSYKEKDAVYNEKRWFNNNEIQQRHANECPPGKTPRRFGEDTKPVFYPFELPKAYIGF